MQTSAHAVATTQSARTAEPALLMAQKGRTANARIFLRGRNVRTRPVPPTTATMVEPVLRREQHTHVPVPLNTQEIDVELKNHSVLLDTVKKAGHVEMDPGLIYTATVFLSSLVIVAQMPSVLLTSVTMVVHAVPRDLNTPVPVDQDSVESDARLIWTSVMMIHAAMEELVTKGLEQKPLVSVP